ncbi:MAG: hypothetical protein ACOCV7_06900 [Desulfonatronovibrionaceae bacterium]
MRTIDELKRLEKLVNEEPIPRARRPWGGADVVIRFNPPVKKSENNFYPDPRYVITRHVLQLSWLFEKLRDAFYAEKRLDSCSKIEFFGRLANAARRCMDKHKNPDKRMLCMAVLNEALSIYHEMEEGSFGCLPIAIGNKILDDYKY